MQNYPRLFRHQFHGGGCEYNMLYVTENVGVKLTEQQLLSLHAQITEYVAPISEESLTAIRAQLNDMTAAKQLRPRP